jgi:hypothetical protein
VRWLDGVVKWGSLELGAEMVHGQLASTHRIINDAKLDTLPFDRKQVSIDTCVWLDHQTIPSLMDPNNQ